MRTNISVACWTLCTSRTSRVCSPSRRPTRRPRPSFTRSLAAARARKSSASASSTRAACLSPSWTYLSKSSGASTSAERRDMPRRHVAHNRSAAPMARHRSSARALAGAMLQGFDCPFTAEQRHGQYTSLQHNVAMSCKSGGRDGRLVPCFPVQLACSKHSAAD